MRSAIALATSMALFGVGCGSTPTAVELAAVEAPVAALVDGNARLDAATRPTRYVLDLRIDPREPRFEGTARIEITVGAPTDRVQLHAKGLEITTARVGGQTAEVLPGINGGVALRVPTPIPAGETAIHLRWTGPLAEVPDGLYRVKEGDAWYAFSQFQALHARQAFPCFDQPEFKTPFRTTLRVPLGMVGLSNSVEESRAEAGELVALRFAETPPLPTYLVAFAVGPFDVVPAPADALGELPLRVITTRGKGVLAGYALEQTPRIHAALTRWFGRPHGFDKIDLVAVPNFAAGAMENAGLVTFRETLLLLDRQAPAQRRMWAQSVIAHELAHMWFGNLVTMAWWNDLWLNEAFATWMAARTVAEVSPELEVDLQSVAGAQWVMSLDAQKHTRAIRQPIRHGGDVENAFDGITYGKGAAVLRMTETWLGPEAFRAGVRAHLGAHARGSATTADLLRALAKASGEDVAGMLARFLDQPGVPLITAEVSCPPGKRPRLDLSQQRYLPTGSEAAGGAPWRVPVCVRFGAAAGASRQCVLLDAPKARFELDTEVCPAWLHPNAHQRGYYQWSLQRGAGGPDLGALVGPGRAQLSAAERVALPGVLAALLEAGVIPIDAYLDTLGTLAEDTHRIVVEGVLNGLIEVHSVAVDDATAEAFARVVRRSLQPHAKRLGFVPRADEPVADKLLRPQVLNALAYMGQDASLRAQARETVQRFLKDPRSVPQEQVVQALPVAAWSGDAALWGALKAALDSAMDPITRSAVLRALSSFEDPALYTRTLDLLLDGTLRAQDMRTVARGAGRPATREAAWRWLTAHHPAIVKLVGPTVAPRLPMVASGFCATADRDAVAAFFSDPAHAPPGTERNLGLVLERIDRCVRLRAAIQAPLGRWLAVHGAPPEVKRPAPAPKTKVKTKTKTRKKAKAKAKTRRGRGKATRRK